MTIRDFNNAIQLTNDGKLSFFFLGTGSAFTKVNFQNNVIVIKGNDHILIDCGTLCPFSFSKFNSNITDIKNILITHSHADHVGGLEEVALMNMYVTKQRPKMILTDEYAGLCLMYAAIHGEEDKKFMPNPADEEQF